MKKQILFVLFILYSTCCFAISNITLHGVDNKILYDIKNNKIYNSDNELIGEIKGERFELIGSENNDNNKITEDKDFITIETDYVIFDYKRHDISTFSKKSGNILKTIDGNYTYTYYETTGKLERLYFYRDGKFSYCTGYVYDKSGNTIKEIDYDENDNIKTITEYIYDKKTNNVIKEIVYDENNQLDYYTTYTYDINTNNVIEECLYNNKNILEEKTEYNPITENEKFYYEYDENGKLLTKRIYDDISGYEIERQLYNGNSKDPEIKKFIQFDENGKYLLEDGYYLNSDFISYFELSFLKKEKLENWNDFYNATFTEITYNQYYPGYKYLIQLLNKDLLFNRSFTLCNNNSTTYYCFDYTEDNRIDFSKCYEIQLIKKEVDYKAMNKSGEGKGPFGIDIGMTYEDVKKACNGKEPELIGDDRYFIEPVNSHPLFDKYIAWISKKYGF